MRTVATPLAPGRLRRRSGFTLAEVAVTIVIVGIAIVLFYEGLMKPQLTAVHSHHQKVARELALMVLARVESGQFWEEVEQTMGPFSFAEEGYPDFYWELGMGESSPGDFNPSLEHDPWAHARQRQLEAEGDDEEDEESEEPYEKVWVRVTFPELTERSNELILERWIPWGQVYGPDEETLKEAAENLGT